MSCMVYTLLIWFLLEYPIEGLMRFYIYKFICKCFSWVKGRSYFRQNSVDFFVEFQVLENFLGLINPLGLGLHFFLKKNGLGY